MAVNTNPVSLDTLCTEYCSAIDKLWEYKKCGLQCNEDLLLDKAHRYYKYIWLFNNVSCGSLNQIDCLVKNNI